MSQSTLYIETPVYSNPEIDARLGKAIYLKMECFQPSGSFKARGIGTLCKEAADNGSTRLVSSSGGNAGYAAAYAGRVLGLKTTVVVPENTSTIARQRIASQGAEVIVQGAAWDEADQYARRLVEEVNGAYIPPFDNPTIWRGNSTMVDEIVTQCPKPGVIVLSVGGGGLLCGVIEGLHRHGWEDVPVIAAETIGADSLAQSIEAGELITLPGITSIATTLGARQVAAQAFAWTQNHRVIPLVVSDGEAVDAAWQFANDQRVLVEPACGASLTVMYSHREALSAFESALVIVCGGTGITADKLLAWKRELVDS